MKKIAIVPWGIEYMGDNLFNLDSSLNRDNGLAMWVKAKKYWNELGYQVHTVDLFENIQEVDFFIFFCFDYEWYAKIRKLRLENKTLYIAFEPPVVDTNHSREGITNILKYFKYVLTWDDDLVDNNRVFKFMYPFNFYNTERAKKKDRLLVNISGNKCSNIKNELYSERKKVIEYFDDKTDFELYGFGWENEGLKSYKGLATSKEEVYARFRFALCLENMKNIKGYVTEKILDCFCCGIVPIYQGASNISDYIPDNTYIHYDQFESIELLYEYIKNMPKADYDNYLNNIERYLKSDKIIVFQPESFAKIVSEVIQNSNMFEFYSASSYRMLKIKSIARYVINKIKKKVGR